MSIWIRFCTGNAGGDIHDYGDGDERKADAFIDRAVDRPRAIDFAKRDAKIFHRKSLVRG